ncbi:hypothetical protein BH11PSE6_BH11PSE6_09770 [soil metagenome]
MFATPAYAATAGAAAGGSSFLVRILYLRLIP